MNNLLTISDVKVAVKNKVPLVRSLTLNWVTYCIETSNKAVVLKLHKDYVPICMEVSELSVLVSYSCSLDNLHNLKVLDMLHFVFVSFGSL